MRAAIYHFTNKSDQRPSICRKQVEQICNYATSNGFVFDENDIYIDKSLLFTEHPEFQRFLNENKLYDALFAKDFYHLSKNTCRCMHIMENLQHKGIKIYTLENGSFVWEEPPYDKPLRVVTYTSRFGDVKERKDSIPVKNDIFRLFAKKKTNWNIIDQFFDESRTQNDGDQVNLWKIIKKREQYDLLFVHNINDIHWRTSNFCRIRKALGIDIYALQNGYLPYMESSSK